MMKTININDYNSNMGVLIDVRNPLEFQKKHHLRAINIYYENLMYNPTKYLDFNKKYFIMCHKGILSEKVVKYLEFLNYDVTKVIQ